MLRKSAFSGSWYPGTARELSHTVGEYLKEVPEVGPIDAKGVIAPHAGFIYSGSTAGAVFAATRITPTVILLCPNHRGVGAHCSLWTRGSWEIPGHELPVDEAFATALLARSALLTEDRFGHLHEHSLEIELPFIAHKRPDVKIVPISLMQLSLDECQQLGYELAAQISEHGDDVLIVASSDMSHQIPADEARRKDFLAIDKVLAMDPEGLYNTVVAHRISMCGYIPATVMLHATKKMGAEKATLIKYANSGDASGDYDFVVGYAGLVVS